MTYSADVLAKRAAVSGIVINTLLAAGKWLAGYFGNSFALIADAIESTGDIFASMLVLLGFYYINRPADHNHPYGHGRLEPLMTFMVVGFLCVSAGFIAYQAVQNISTPHQSPEPYTLLVLVLIIAIKEIAFRRINKSAQSADSTALKAEAWHHRSDAITSAAAFIGILLAVWLGEGYESLDDWAALLASAFILYNAYHIFRPALGEIMDEAVYHDLVELVRTKSLEVEHIKGTEKCHVRKAGFRYFIDLHAMVDGNLTVQEGHLISHRLKDYLMAEIPGLADVLVHIEPEVYET